MLEKYVEQQTATSAPFPKPVIKSSNVSEAEKQKNGARLTLDVESDGIINNNVGELPLKLVIFDKDGTLISFHAMWGPWCEMIADRLEETSGFALRSNLFQLFCYNRTTGKIGKGSLAESPHEVVKEEVVEMLQTKYGATRSSATALTEDAWHTVTAMEESLKSAVEPVGDVRAMFVKLRAAGVKIAICTSDSRHSTMVAVKSLGIGSLVDRILCGDDDDNTPKPAPENVRLLCSELGVMPGNAVVVGDTPADTEMGHSSNAKIVIGVLSGVCTMVDLAPASHYVVDTIQDALPILLDCLA